MKVITIANQKGGVGKTSTAVTIAHGLSLRKRRVAIIDLDPQGQASTALGVRQEPGVFSLLIQKLPVSKVIRFARENLYIIPGNNDTAMAQTVLGVMKSDVSMLRESLKDLSALDYIVIDTAPSVGDLQAMAVWAADYVLIPTACDYASAEGTFKLEATISELVNSYSWNGRLIGVLPTFFDTVTNETKQTVMDLVKHFGSAVLPPIHRATIMREAYAAGKTIFEIDKNSRPAIEYARLVDYIVKVTM